jgi:glyoxylase-like metal-dependent hydrolase (beta-lactamase superfamily II)
MLRYVATALVILVASAVSTGCQWFERSAIDGSIRSGFLEINTPGEGVTKLADDLYTYKWYGYRTAFITTPEGVIVFDPLNDDAATKLAREIARVAPNPTIRYVIYSHNHADHTQGARRLGGNPVIVAHATAAKLIAERPDPEVAPPTETFEGDEKDITLGGTTVKLLHVPGAHTEGMLVIQIPHRRALYAVDFVVVHMVPAFGSPYNSYHGVLGAIDKVQALDYDTLIPGHGPVGTKQDATAFATLLRDMESSLKDAAVAHGMFPMHGNPAAVEDPHVGEVLFAAMDSLAPKYHEWQGWDHNALYALNWVYLYGLYMNE